VGLDEIRSAFDAFADGDVEPLVALMDPSMEWRGLRRVRFWRKPPS
jgi:ketosteroid isomerase-like protein